MQTWFDAQLDQKILDGIYYLCTQNANLVWHKVLILNKNDVKPFHDRELEF